MARSRRDSRDPSLSAALPRPTTERLLWGVVVLALVADVALTTYGLSLDLRELNPVARWVYDVAGWGGLLVSKSVVVAVAAWLRRYLPRTYRPLVPAALAVPWIAAATLNALTVAGAT